MIWLFICSVVFECLVRISLCTVPVGRFVRMCFCYYVRECTSVDMVLMKKRRLCGSVGYMYF